jgi:hypothetical protein
MGLLVFVSEQEVRRTRALRKEKNFVMVGRWHRMGGGET